MAIKRLSFVGLQRQTAVVCILVVMLLMWSKRLGYIIELFLPLIDRGRHEVAIEINTFKAGM